ncbi:MAG: cytidyltransferase-like protein [Bacillariaceae sp.]|jgi:cytidyltransferase-like protein
MTKSPLDDLKAFWLAIYVGLALAVVILVVLVYQICWPKILTYPWKEEEEEEKQIYRTVIFAASYNPPHHGHVRILEYLSKRYTKVIAVVGFNPNKEYLVSPEQRRELLRDMLKSTSATNVEVDGESIGFESLLGPISFVSA